MTVAVAQDIGLQKVRAGFSAVQLSGLNDPFVSQAQRWVVSPFQSQAFLTTLMATIGRAHEAELVLIGVSDPDGTPVALFPFTLVREHGLRVIEGMGLGVVDYFVPLTAPGSVATASKSRAVWRAVRKALPKADVLRLRNVPRLALGACHALSAAPFLKAMGHAATTVVARDPAGASIYDIKALPLNRPLRKWIRRLEGEFGKVGFRAAETAEDIDHLLDLMVAYRLGRFADLGRRDAFSDPSIVAFYRQLAQPRSGGALARLYGLWAGEELVGVIYGLPQGDTFTSVISSMSSDPRWSRVSPGVMAMYCAIEDCVNRGNRIYDLSIGELGYKNRYGGETIELYEHREARSLLGLPATLLGKARTALRVYLRAHPKADAFIRRRPAPAAVKSED